MKELVLSNARIVTADSVVHGSVRVRDGRIADIDSGGHLQPGATDCDGDWLVPGLVELHTDNLESCYMPRPGVCWPAIPALLNHDAQVVAAGITTVLDALCIGDIIDMGLRKQGLTDMARAIDDASTAGLTRAEHQLHLRCEVSDPELGSLFAEFCDHPRVALVSVMDHTPGQRQFIDEEAYRVYFSGKYNLTGAELDGFITTQKRSSELHAGSNRSLVIEHCRERRICLASHDDATSAHVDEAAENGIQISEFPTTVEAAERARGAGLAVMMGAPNIVRGKSHSGNVSARELAGLGLLDMISSDYYPSSLLQAVMVLSRELELMSLPAAVALVSKNPAAAIGLDDRGEIAVGKLADLIRVSEHGGLPVIRTVWRLGEPVF